MSFCKSKRRSITVAMFYAFAASVALTTLAALPEARADDGLGRGGKAVAKWLSGDFHQHTLYTDGSTAFDFAMRQSDTFGLDWWANSEHGGERNRNGEGAFWDALIPPPTILGAFELSGGHREMWRWQSLRDFAFSDVVRNRGLYPDKRIFSGLEWNVPGHEHCSTAVVARDASAISAFEYQFDNSDDDFLPDVTNDRAMAPYGTLTK